MTTWPRSLTMIGCGNMGGAMLDRWLAAGLPLERVTVVNRSGVAPRDGVATLTRLPPEPPAVLVVAVKPQQLAQAAHLLAELTAPPDLLVSILAGVDLTTLQTRLPARSHIRALPNLPVALGQGVTLLHGDERARAMAEALAAPLGLAEWIDEEPLFDAATALAGSGPGFLFRFIAALAQGGVALGLADDQAARLALATVAGAAELARQADVLPDELAAKVASRGGSTQAGYDVLDADAALAGLVTQTLQAATRRNAELGAAARTDA